MRNPLLVPELRELLAAQDFDALQKFCLGSHPADIAEFLAALLPVEIWSVLAHLDADAAAEIFTHLDEDVQVDVVGILGRKDLAWLMTHMVADDRADLFRELPESKQEDLLPALAQAEREDIRRLAAYPDRTAGAVMTSEYVSLSPTLTANEAIAKLRREAPDKETIYSAYVVDENRKLLGNVSLKDLILARPDSLVKNLMNKDVIYVRTTDDQEEAARKISKYDLLALPVVNGNNALVGIITHDDAIDIINQEHFEDMEKFMAITGEHEAGAYLRTPVWTHFKNRASWIVGLAALGLVSGVIIHSYEATLVQLLILALYMPMVADTGGNTGSQSATVVIRALALKELTPRDFFKVLKKEFLIALMLSVVLGALSFGKVLFLSQNSTIPLGFSLPMIGLAIAVALALQVITSTMIGAALPLIAVRYKLDPAVIASPALTTIVDITGLLLYFSTARFILGGF